MRLFALGSLCISLFLPLSLPGQTVRFETNVGNIDVQLLPNDAPKTVANFLAYLNLVDNSANLDSSNGGFTAFGRVANDSGLAVMDLIGNEPTYDASGLFGSADFTDLPLVNYNGNFSSQNLVLITAILVVPGIASNAIIA